MNTLLNTLRLCGPGGSNKIMAGELSRLHTRALGGRLDAPKKVGAGMLTYPFSLELAALAVTYHRTSSRVLMDLCESSAQRLEDLYRDLREAFESERRPIFEGVRTLSVTVSQVQEFPAGGRQIVGTVKNAVIDALATRGQTLAIDPEHPEIVLSARQVDQRVVVSVDLVGHSMSRRGYRHQGGLAPLRENIAAQLVMLSRFDPRSELLIDPMAGSGTIAIEAAAMARALPLWVGASRPLAESLRYFAGVTFDRGALFADSTPTIVALDIDPAQVKRIEANARRAGVADRLHVAQADIDDLDVTRWIDTSTRTAGAGVLLCNPPYGDRLEDFDLARIYRSLADAYGRLPTGWRACVYTANRAVLETFPRRPRVTKSLRNATVPAVFYRFDR